MRDLLACNKGIKHTLCMNDQRLLYLLYNLLYDPFEFIPTATKVYLIWKLQKNQIKNHIIDRIQRAVPEES